jgi:hypothetical protein
MQQQKHRGVLHLYEPEAFRLLLSANHSKNAMMHKFLFAGTFNPSEIHREQISPAAFDKPEPRDA